MADEGLSGLHNEILELLRSHPQGLTIYEIREKFPNDPGIQQHLDRRVRDLRRYYDVPLEKGGKYVFKGRKKKQPEDSGAINAKMRAAVLNIAHGRCQMCGRTVVDDGIKLQADHKVPKTWGGPTTLENLWALCQLCNGGKRDFFASFDEKEMQKVVQLESVHARLAEMLHLRNGQPIPSWILEFVANVNDFQEDWHRRLRELRSIGIDYVYKRTRLPSGKVETTYALTKWKALPANHQAIIKQNERKGKRP
jgi:5-methylcytosine-specific restriction endonuclease McrA